MNAAQEAVLYAALNMNGRVVYSHESRENVEMNAGYIRTPTRFVGLVAIAPPVAAGSVDTVESDNFLLVLALCTQERREAKVEDKYYRRLVAHINAWGAQQREAGRQESEPSGRYVQVSDRDQWRRRAEKAEAELSATKKLMSRFWTGQYFDGVTKGDAAEINEALT